MAKIIENKKGRRLIRLSADDIISVVREYQTSTIGKKNYYEIRAELERKEVYLPEDI